MHVPMKFLAGALALGLSACALESTVRPPSLDDPSNPDAPESRPYPSSSALRAPEPPPAGAHPHPHGAHASPGPEASILATSDTDTPATGVYTCPMHPKVTSAEPGRCSQCGMKLVPREPPPPSGGAR